MKKLILSDEEYAVLQKVLRTSSNREIKNKRLNVVLRPSVYDKLVAAADADGRSINGFLEKLILENT